MSNFSVFEREPNKFLGFSVVSSLGYPGKESEFTSASSTFLTSYRTNRISGAQSLFENGIGRDFYQLEAKRETAGSWSRVIDQLTVDPVNERIAFISTESFDAEPQTKYAFFITFVRGKIISLQKFYINGGKRYQRRAASPISPRPRVTFPASPSASPSPLASPSVSPFPRVSSLSPRPVFSTPRSPPPPPSPIFVAPPRVSASPVSPSPPPPSFSSPRQGSPSLPLITSPTPRFSPSARQLPLP